MPSASSILFNAKLVSKIGTQLRSRKASARSRPRSLSSNAQIALQLRHRRELGQHPIAALSTGRGVDSTPRNQPSDAASIRPSCRVSLMTHHVGVEDRLTGSGAAPRPFRDLTEFQFFLTNFALNNMEDAEGMKAFWESLFTPPTRRANHESPPVSKRASCRRSPP